jgi:predicted transcriptional regulator
LTTITVRQIKQPSFEGIHNAVRAKTYLVLLEYSLNYRYGTGLNARDIARLSGCSYRTILCSLGKWTKRRYILRVHCHGYYHYRIAKRGSKWLDRHIQGLRLPVEKYIQEMEQAPDKF